MPLAQRVKAGIQLQHRDRGGSKAVVGRGARAQPQQQRVRPHPRIQVLPGPRILTRSVPALRKVSCQLELPAALHRRLSGVQKPRRSCEQRGPESAAPQRSPGAPCHHAASKQASIQVRMRQALLLSRSKRFLHSLTLREGSAAGLVKAGPQV